MDAFAASAEARMDRIRETHKGSNEDPYRGFKKHLLKEKNESMR